ncbi:MFS transporter [Saccharopolyspora hirsuta]|uniref:MFS transporter n=1 Tax=Saccharopolyspora hirsuta TaxID=1837 RepID=UPI00331F355D
MVGTHFSQYWLSAFLSDFGDGVRLAAFPLLALQVTDAPAAVVAVTAVQQVPWLLAGLGFGAVVDRYDLRRIMVAVDVVRALAIAVLSVSVVAGAVNLPLIYLTAFITGSGELVRDTAAATAAPRLVDPNGLERANGRLMAGRLVGNELAGPAVGGWAFGIAAALPFGLNAGGLGLSALLLLTLPSVFAARPRQPGAVGVVRDLREGFRWLRGDRPVRNMVLAVGLVAVADGALLALLVLYVTRVLGLGAEVYGLLLAFGALGGVVAGAFCARVSARLGPLRVLSATVLIMTSAHLVLGLTSNLYWTAAALVLSSGAFAMFNVTSLTLRQRRSPAEMLGRVNSTYLTVGRAAEALGALAGGALATVAGIQVPILAGVLPLVVAAVLIARAHPFRQPA